MQPDLNRVIEQVSKEKGIDKKILVSALEQAMVSAAKKSYGHQKKIEAQFNADLGEVELFEAKLVVDAVKDPSTEIQLDEARQAFDPDAEIGDELLCKLDMSVFGRIEAQAAKQNIIQSVRNAEREIIYNEFKGRQGELIHGIVQRFEKKNIIVNLGRTDAILPEREQVPREHYRQGDRICCYIVGVDLTSRGPQITLSRTHPGMLIKLFAQEIPEIYEGIVQIKDAAREPGGRSKVAVISVDSDVDPVGACVGMKGIRIQAVVQELRGEKIDIVHWKDDQAEYVCRALAPATVSKIIMDEDEHSMEVIIPDDQLSLAIGKKGQNVRLAARLTGWKIDVRGEREADEETRRARASLGAIDGLGDVIAELLYQSGFKSAEELADAYLTALLTIEGIEKDRALAIMKASREHVAEKKKKEQERADREASLKVETESEVTKEETAS
jgi:N utilization substance protein A